jgi:hypothetical protein
VTAKVIKLVGLSPLLFLSPTNLVNFAVNSTKELKKAVSNLISKFYFFGQQNYFFDQQNLFF